jgi:hypothetical protein
MPLIGEATVRIGADDSRLRRGLDSAGKWTKAKFAAIGVAAAGAFAAAFAADKLREVINATAAIKTFSTQAGITADEWQRLNFVIERANGDASDSVSIMLDLKRAMADARTGKKEWVDRFALFGVTMEQIKKDDPVALFDSLGRAVAKTTELTGEQVDALGKMMGEDTSARAIAAFRNNFVEAMGSVQTISGETVESMYELDQAIKQLNAQTLREMAKILAENKDSIMEIINAASAAVSKMAEIMRAVKSLKNFAGGMSIAEAVRSPSKFAGYAQEEINQIYSGFDSKANQRTLEIAAMPFGRSEEDKQALRRGAWDAIYAKAQKDSLEVLKQIRDKTGSGASTDIAVMGGL